MAVYAVHCPIMSCKHSSKPMSCKHSSKPMSCKHSSRQSTHSSLSQQAYSCSQLTATGSFAVAGTVKPCHATTAAYCYHYVQIMSLRTKQIWPHTVGTMLQPVFETALDSCRHISSSQQAYSCSEMTTCALRTNLIWSSAACVSRYSGLQ